MRLRLLVLTSALALATSLAADGPRSGLTSDDELNRLIKQLGSSSFDERERAEKVLIAIGLPALERLKAASKDADAETRRRAESCLEAIEREFPRRIPAGVTVIRLPPDEEFSLMNVGTKEKPRLRLTCGKITIEGPRLFLGDGNLVQGIEAVPGKTGGTAMNFLKPSGEPGPASGDGEIVVQPGAKGVVVYNRGQYARADQLKPGSIYVVAPAFRLLPEGENNE